MRNAKEISEAPTALFPPQPERMTFADCAAAGFGVELEAECDVCGAVWRPDPNSEALRHRTIASVRLACIAIGANGKPPCPGTGLARIRRDLPVLQVSLVDRPGIR